METNHQKAALRFGILGALATAIGIILSGPVGLALVTLLAPNPTWTDAATWAAHYHPLQTFPFYGGFLLVGGYVMTMAAFYQIAAGENETEVEFNQYFAETISPRATLWVVPGVTHTARYIKFQRSMKDGSSLLLTKKLLMADD